MNSIRKEIRNQIRKILLEQYKSGDVSIARSLGRGAFSNSYQSNMNSEYSENPESNVPVYSPGNPTSNNTQGNPKSTTNSPPTSNSNKQGNQATYSDRQINTNHVQFKEGYEVKKVAAKEVKITNLNSSKSSKYNIKKDGKTLTIDEIKISGSGVNVTLSFSFITKTAVLDENKKREIVAEFESGSSSFSITGKDTSGSEETVTFVKI